MEIFDAVCLRETETEVVWCENVEHTAMRTRKNQAGEEMYFIFKCFFFASRIQPNNKILQKRFRTFLGGTKFF